MYRQNPLGKTIIGGFAALSIVAVLLVAAFTNDAQATPASTGFNTTPVHVKHFVRPVPRITDLKVLRLGESERFDRVVIYIHGKMPGYDVRFVNKLVEDGSGEPVHIKGNKFVQITLNLAYAHKQDGSPTYVGPDRAEYISHPVRSSAFIGDFEGYVTFGIGLRYKAPFRVTEVNVAGGPDRLLVDFKRDIHEG